MSASTDKQKTFHAWAAGIVDGEGCIAIKRNIQGGKIYYSLWVTVGQSGKIKPAIIQTLEQSYGGSTSQSRDKRSNRLPRWNWTASNQNAEAMLIRILPYLVGKADQARVALEYRKSALGRGNQVLAADYYWKLRGFKNYQQKGTQKYEVVV
jgi:hypothetical protein